MKQSHRIGASVAVGAATFGVVYLLGSFCSVSFSLSEWDTGFRYMTGIFGGMISCVAALEFHYSLPKQRNQ